MKKLFLVCVTLAVTMNLSFADPGPKTPAVYLGCGIGQLPPVNWQGHYVHCNICREDITGSYCRDNNGVWTQINQCLTCYEYIPFHGISDIMALFPTVAADALDPNVDYYLVIEPYFELADGSLVTMYILGTDLRVIDTDDGSDLYCNVVESYARSGD